MSQKRTSGYPLHNLNVDQIEFGDIKRRSTKPMREAISTGVDIQSLVHETIEAQATASATQCGFSRDVDGISFAFLEYGDGNSEIL